MRCHHMQKDYKPTETATAYAKGCEECVKIGARWVHLRQCIECGHVGCCDSSPNRHATKHYTETKHRVMRSVEPRERWLWCYQDEVMAEY